MRTQRQAVEARLKRDFPEYRLQKGWWLCRVTERGAIIPVRRLQTLQGVNEYLDNMVSYRVTAKGREALRS